MKSRAILIGILMGLLIGGVIGVLRGPCPRPAAPPVPLAEDGGRITRVVMQYQPEAGALVIPIYRRFLSAIGKDVEVIWVVGKAADTDDLRARLGAAWPSKRSRVVVVGKAITTWAKDRFTALAIPGRDAVVLCSPARARTANLLRTNDQEVPYRLAQDAGALFETRETEVDFDGGDILATSRHLFVSPLLFEKNPSGAGARFTTKSELTDYLTRALSGAVTWLGDTPDSVPPHHVGMYLTVMGKMAAVGDVRLAEYIAAAHPEARAALRVASGAATPAFTADLRARLERVARRMQSLGYTVVRVPLLPSATPRAWMSYNNGVVETRGGNTIFYMPTFGADALDTAAADLFRAKMHCTVVPIDCAKVWRLGGSLHCLVNVVARAK